MSSKTYRSLHDWVRHGQNIHLVCGNGHCANTGVVDAYSACLWFKLHRWPDALEAGALRHFRCVRCGSTAGNARPTEQPVTVTEFFPVSEDAWVRLWRRLRG